MSLRGFLTAVHKRWLTVLCLALAGVAGSAAFSFLQTPLYSSQTGVFFSIQFGASASELAQGATYTQNSVTSFATLATEPIVLDSVIDALGLDVTAAALADRVQAAVAADTAIVEVSVSDPSPVQAAAIAAAIADQLSVTVERLSPENANGESTVQAAIVAPAVVATSAESPNVPVNLAVGILGGLLLGLGGAYLTEILDTRVRTAGDVLAVTTAPVLGAIGEFPSPGRGLVVSDAPSGLHAEAFRQVRTNLQFLGIDSESCSIVISSALPAEGKSTVAANLAIALAETTARVLLVDADLRQPSMAELLNLEGSAGLTTVLIGRAEFDDVVQQWGDRRLDVLTSGLIPPNPSELLASPGMALLVNAVQARYDYVILDTAPLLAVTDAAILSRLALGTIVVANPRRVRQHQLAQGLGFLAQVDARVLGVVLNATQRDTEQYGYQPRPRVSDEFAPERAPWGAAAEVGKALNGFPQFPPARRTRGKNRMSVRAAQHSDREASAAQRSRPAV